MPKLGRKNTTKPSNLNLTSQDLSQMIPSSKISKGSKKDHKQQAQHCPEIISGIPNSPGRKWLDLSLHQTKQDESCFYKFLIKKWPLLSKESIRNTFNHCRSTICQKRKFIGSFHKNFEINSTMHRKNSQKSPQTPRDQDLSKP